MTLRSLRSGRALSATVMTALFAIGVATGALLNSRQPGRTVFTPASAAPASPLRPGYRAEVLRVLDGDTFEARVHVWPGIDITTKVRLRRIDAAEMRARCPQERAKAEAAREALRTLLDEGEVMVMHVGLDKYGGRVLAEAGTRATPDVGTALLERGLVRAYSGGRRESWCDGS